MGMNGNVAVFLVMLLNYNTHNILNAWFNLVRCIKYVTWIEYDAR